eukprot:SAG31_NODE_25266_length_464_cov_5.936986_1_plen_78_part_01
MPRHPTDPFGTCALSDCSSLRGGGWCATLVDQNLSVLEIQVRMCVLESLVKIAQILTLCCHVVLLTEKASFCVSAIAF